MTPRRLARIVESVSFGAALAPLEMKVTVVLSTDPLLQGALTIGIVGRAIDPATGEQGWPYYVGRVVNGDDLETLDHRGLDRLIREVAVEWLTHELDEGLRVGDRRPFDPHRGEGASA